VQPINFRAKQRRVCSLHNRSTHSSFTRNQLYCPSSSAHKRRPHCSQAIAFPVQSGHTTATHTFFSRHRTTSSSLAAISTSAQRIASSHATVSAATAVASSSALSLAFSHAAASTAATAATAKLTNLLRTNHGAPSLGSTSCDWTTARPPSTHMSLSLAVRARGTRAAFCKQCLDEEQRLSGRLRT
jgi:hypothetical protein